MHIKNKIDQINSVLDSIKKSSSIVIWGAGEHTEKLFAYTKINNFNNLAIVDKNPSDIPLFGITIQNIKDYDWSQADYILISSCKNQNAIMNNIKRIPLFKGDVLKFYNDNEVNAFYKLKTKDDSLGFAGDYKTWIDASVHSTGYDDSKILDKVKESTLAILAGKGAYERDSVIFKDIVFSFHILAYIEKIAITNNKVTILDFGGALGSTYLQNKNFLLSIPAAINWIVIEQPEFTKVGNDIYKEDNNITFLNSISQLTDMPNLILFSGVLQYIDSYKIILADALNLNAEYIIVDRTFVAERERICIETVPEKIYKAVYPLRIFNEKEFIAIFQNRYNLEYEYHSYVDEDIIFEDMTAFVKGFIFKKSTMSEGEHYE